MTEQEYSDFLAAKKREEEYRQQHGIDPKQPGQTPQPKPEQEPTAASKEEPGTIRKLIRGVREGVSAAKTLSKPGEIAKRLPEAKRQVVAGAKHVYYETKKEAVTKYREAGGASGIIRSVGSGALGATQRGATRMVESDRNNFYNEVGVGNPRRPQTKIKTVVKKTKTTMKRQPAHQISYSVGGLQSTLPRPAVGFSMGGSLNSLPGWTVGSAPMKKATPTKTRRTSIPMIGIGLFQESTKPTGKPNPLFAFGKIPRIGFSAPVKKSQKRGGVKNGKKK